MSMQDIHFKNKRSVIPRETSFKGIVTKTTQNHQYNKSRLMNENADINTNKAEIRPITIRRTHTDRRAFNYLKIGLVNS